MSYIRRGRGFLSISYFYAAVQWLGMGLVAFLFCAPLFSQTSQGTIQGAVLDQTGGSVSGARVAVTDVARGITRALTTDSAGQYVANALNPGTYTVRAEAQGFKAVERNGVLIEVGQNIRLDLVVQPGEQTQTVTVTEELPLINATDATMGGTISNAAINDLPLNGRDYTQLLALRPGTVTIIGGGTGRGNQTNGRRNSNDMQRIEGIAGMAQSQGSNIINGTYRTGDIASILPIDAIQEFNTQQNPKAEYGFRDGAIVTVGVKSGTNGLHGTAYAFGRDGKATDAANYFTKKVAAADVQQFGATAGGPILKDKLFWFIGYEGQRIKVSDITNNTIPADVAMGNPAFSMVDACNAIKASGGTISPLSAQISGLNTATCVVTPGSATVENLWPYTTDTTTTGNYVAPLTITSPTNNGIAKVNYALSENHHLSGMYFKSKSKQLGKQFPGIIQPFWQTPSTNNVQQTNGSWTWTPNSNWVNDFRVGLVFLQNTSPAGDENVVASDPWPKGYGMNTGVTTPLYGGMPQIQISAFTGYLGTGNQTTSRGPEGDIDFVENISYLRGKHSMKFGVEFLRVFIDGNKYRQAQGNVVFSTLQNYLTGNALRGTILLGDPSEQAVSHWFSTFVQDDWRIKPRLTVNLGLRYEYAGSPTERHNYMGNFNPDVNPATTPAVQQVGPGAPLSSLYHARRLDFSPRLGVAWDVQGNAKTVVRAAVGVYRNPAQEKAFIRDAVPFGANFPSIGVNTSGTDINAHSPVQPTFTCSVAGSCNNLTASIAGKLNWNLAGPIFPTIAAQVINGVTYTGTTCTAAAPCPMPAVDPNFLDPYSVQWNFGIQRALTSRMTLDVAYVGNRGFNEQLQFDLNQPPIGTGWAGAPTTACLASAPLYNKCTVSTAQEAAAAKYMSAFPYLSVIGMTTNGGFSNYNGLHTTLQARGYHGLSFLAGYTYSHALSISDGYTITGVGGIADKNNPRLAYGNGASDIRHRFTFAPTYDIPGIKSPAQMLEGWSLSTIVVLQGGVPWGTSDSTIDYLGTTSTGGGSPWNYTGPTSAFTVTQNPIPCFGKFSGCTPYATVGGVPQLPAACVSAATAPYGGATTVNGQLAIAALTNAGCYVRGDGILTPPAYGTYGNAGNIFRGQKYYNVDFTVAKTWRVQERYSAQFRVEFFNFFNHPDFAGLGGGGSAVTITTPNSGTGGGFGYATVTPDVGNNVIGSGGPRHVQFGLKLTF